MRAPAEVGQSLAEVDTPALILDLDAFEKNLQVLKNAVEGRVRVRPHAKTHKCPEVAKRQIALGAVGMCCARPWYACSPPKRRFGYFATSRASATAGSPGATPQRRMPTSSST